MLELDKKQVIITSSIIIETPIGEMIAYATENGICLLEFTDRKNMERQMQGLSTLAEINLTDLENRHIRLLKEELSEYFAGKLTTFSVELDMLGTDFQKRVWSQLLSIPYGKTISYIQEARLMGIESSVRAVANANGANKIAIIIPCHRVIGTNKTLTGYAGGLVRKRYLLDLESPEKSLFD
ncbi:methylated-DNA--[protein]-cysteine S-methyltransferase [Dysgonomonas capnocytophagoides]|uniref:methylated-DNA--[protein]-cysteine S-methyltransferase n=1 Tax=Dysgonomonas capnocytophagoides TaxID=45254 RepID=A0A4Y8KY67_9BACT|nr:methylated-DNA--[protein]-cysteine S-methyltransferase [Dysgonomonas capnocytophagoides]